MKILRNPAAAFDLGGGGDGGDGARRRENGPTPADGCLDPAVILELGGVATAASQTPAAPGPGRAAGAPAPGPPAFLGAARGDALASAVCVGLSVAQGIAVPIMKVIFIAMAEKLLRETLQASLPEELYQELEARVFDETPAVTSVYLLRSFTFYQAFALCAAVVFFIAVAFPVTHVLKKDYLNKREVRRLQSLIVKKFIVEPNSVDVDLADATHLLHTRMAAVEHYVSEVQYKFYENFAVVFSGLFLFMLLAWDLGLITLVACTLIMTLTDLIYAKLGGPWVKRREDREATVNARILDLVVCRDVITTHGQELEEQQEMEKLLENEDVHEETRVLGRASFVSEFFKSFTFTLIQPGLFVYIYAFDLTLARVFQILIIIVVLEEMVQGYVRHLNDRPFVDEYMRAKQEFSHMLGMSESDLFPKRFRTTKTGPENGRDPCSVPNTEKLLWQEGGNSIELANATFGYTLKDGSIFRAIENFSASFRLGDRYAIMGETGAGKSTVFKGLAGLLKPIEGAISVNGDAVDTTSTQWRRDNIGVVSQDSILFNRSLRENLSYGIDGDFKGGESDAILLEALDKVNMKHIVLEQLPNGLDTQIIGNGSEFSGGQRQRLQICRLLLRNRPLVLLDEFTSALDRATMEDILKVLDGFMSTGENAKTLIMVTHDIQTLDLAQHVLNVFPGGKYEMQRVK